RRTDAGGREVFVRQTVGTYVSTVTASAAAPAGKDPLVLQIEAEPTRYTFAWGTSPHHPQSLGAPEPRPLSTDGTGGFVGIYVGMYALGATAAFDWFDYEGHE